MSAIDDMADSANWIAMKLKEMTAERDRLKAEVENCIMNLAACSTYALGYEIDQPPPDLNPTRAAVRDVLRAAYRERDWRTVAEQMAGALKNQMSYHAKKQSAHAQRCYSDCEEALKDFDALKGVKHG
jgi:hypothetical protein